MNQLTLETAVAEAIEDGIATGNMPAWWMGWQRNDPKGSKPQPVEELVEDGLEHFTRKCGMRPDTVVCCPENVERVSNVPGIIVRTMSHVWHPGYFLLGSSTLERCGR